VERDTLVLSLEGGREVYLERGKDRLATIIVLSLFSQEEKDFIIRNQIS